MSYNFYGQRNRQRTAEEAAPIPLRLSKQTMPNGTVYCRGNMKALKTMDIQELSAVLPKGEASFVKILLPMPTTNQGANL